METTIVYRGYVGLLQEKMETTTYGLGLMAKTVSFLQDVHNNQHGNQCQSIPPTSLAMI